MNKIQSILVTGGSGSFGQAFVRFLLDKTQVQRICIYSRGEHAQAVMRSKFNSQRLRWMIGDVRDLPRLTTAMRGVDAVVHAAALKRIEVGAYCPEEMIKTNVLGAMNVVEAANAAGSVRFVVGLSTDKAYQPVSPYGLSKALAESLLLAANITHAGSGPKFAACRYGNVTGSQGSVVPVWKQMIAAGAAAVPLTDLRCTRFHMTMGEAVQLVWDTLTTMSGGELVIPDWLPAYLLEDLVEAFGVSVKITGLPAWEKLHESMNEKLCSKTARRLTVEELKEIIQNA